MRRPNLFVHVVASTIVQGSSIHKAGVDVASGKVILLEWNDASPVLAGRKRCLFDYLFTAPQNPVNLWTLFKRSSLLLFGHQSAQEKASVRGTLL